jgi:hypothetical protein
MSSPNTDPPAPGTSAQEAAQADQVPVVSRAKTRSRQKLMLDLMQDPGLDDQSDLDSAWGGDM